MGLKLSIGREESPHKYPYPNAYMNIADYTYRKADKTFLVQTHFWPDEEARQSGKPPIKTPDYIIPTPEEAFDPYPYFYGCLKEISGFEGSENV